MRIGVVVPVWRRARLVQECLDRVAAQSRPPERVVVVDDESGDETPQAVTQWIRAHPQVAAQLICKAHAGAAAARNAGLAALTDVTHVAFLDSDDLWPPDLLARAEAVFSPGVMAVSSDRRRKDERRGIERNDDLSGLARDPFTWLFSHGAGVGSCTVLDVAAVRRAGGYREELRTGEDMALFLAVAAQGSWGHVPGAPVHFRLGHRATYGEADHVHRLHNDATLRRARLYEELAELHAERVPLTVRKRALAWKWWRAALAMRAQGRTQEARDALGRARAHRPGSLRLRWASIRWSNSAAER